MQPLPVSISLSRVILVVRNECALHIPITVGRKDVEARAFIDSGATGIFISPRFIREHRLRTEPLPRPIPVFNMDGTLNKEALITRRALLSYKISGEPRFVKAYIASIGKEDIIFGHTWLKLENPKIDWKTGRVELNHRWTKDKTRAWKMDLYQRGVARLELKKAVTTPLPEPTEDEFIVISTSEHATLPERKTSGAAGYDISAVHQLIIPA